MFGYLSQLGLSRDHPLPQQTTIADKVETLVQKRLVSEAYLRRQKKANDADTWQYAAGARANGDSGTLTVTTALLILTSRLCAHHRHGHHKLIIATWR